MYLQGQCSHNYKKKIIERRQYYSTNRVGKVRITRGESIP